MDFKKINEDKKKTESEIMKRRQNNRRILHEVGFSSTSLEPTQSKKQYFTIKKESNNA